MTKDELMNLINRSLFLPLSATRMNVADRMFDGYSVYGIRGWEDILYRQIRVRLMFRV